MGWVPLLVAVLFFAPLYAIGELGVWSFEEPRSHLRWDEASGAAPMPADEPGGLPMLAAQLVGGALMVGALAWLTRSPRTSPAPPGRRDQQD